MVFVCSMILTGKKVKPVPESEWAKSIPCSRQKRWFWDSERQNPYSSSGTSPYSPYMGVTLTPTPFGVRADFEVASVDVDVLSCCLFCFSILCHNSRMIILLVRWRLLAVMICPHFLERWAYFVIVSLLQILLFTKGVRQLKIWQLINQTPS